MLEYIKIGNIFRDWRIEPVTVQLTDYGTVFINNDEYNFEDFEKTLNHDYHSYITDFFYDEIAQCFTLVYWLNDQGHNRSIRVGITEKQKKLIKSVLINDNKQTPMENDDIDNSIQKLMQIADRKKRDKKKKLINSRVQKTGELPSSNEEIILYAEYLEEELERKKVEMTKRCRRLSFVPFLFAPAIHGGIIKNYLELFGLGGIAIIVFGESLLTAPIELIESIKDFKMLYYKLLLLEEKVKELALEEKKASAGLLEAPKVKVYTNQKYS